MAALSGGMHDKRLRVVHDQTVEALAFRILAGQIAEATPSISRCCGQSSTCR
jgi:hypothetical protein